MPRTPRCRRRWSARGTAGPSRGCAPSTPSSPTTAPTWRTATIHLPPGTYRYAILVGDLRLKDELNPRSAFVAGPDDPFEIEVSEVELADCNAPALSPPPPRTPTATRSSSRPTSPPAPTASPSTRRPLAATLTQAGAPVGRHGRAHATAARADATHVTARAAGLGAGKYTLTLQRARSRRGRAARRRRRQRLRRHAARPRDARRHARLPGHDRSLPRRRRRRWPRRPRPAIAPAARSTACAPRSTPATSIASA